jgi:hypothetical protein
VDVIDLGERVKSFVGKAEKISPVCALVFETGEVNEDGNPHAIQKEFTVSMFERAGLRQFLEAWRGKSYTEAEAQAGVPLNKLVGHAALVSVEHKTSASGRVYATFRTIGPLPKAIAVPDIPPYVRADYWADRKTEYAAEVAKHRPPAPQEFADVPDALQDGNDDDLPF